MNFRNHLELKDQHAFLGASRYSWLRYDELRLVEAFASYMAAQKGTELHAFAAQCIKLGQKLPKSNKTLNLYVNDAIGFRMTPEQPLVYSENCFGTADSIAFRNDFLRIHDYKSGVTEASMDQPLIYSALFCLEYHINPFDIVTELRIYQSDVVRADRPEPGDISAVMDKIVAFDKIISKIKLEGA